jgi:hypothetical protein
MGKAIKRLLSDTIPYRALLYVKQTILMSRYLTRMTKFVPRSGSADTLFDLICVLTFTVWPALSAAAEPRNLNAIPNDLRVPPVTAGTPRPGARVWQTNPRYEGWDVAHALYLPTDWNKDRRFPVLVEFPGNGNFQNALGDRCDGSVEGCEMGYGLSGGHGMIWVSMPFVDSKIRALARVWWGDPEETATYCRQAADQICREYGGDSKRLVLIGFSRGAIACNYIGLRDDRTAGLWCGFIAHSHYDGVRAWEYRDSDATSAKTRLNRLGDRPQFISHEISTSAVEAYLNRTYPRGKFTFAAVPYSNHSSSWVLKELPVRNRARTWLKGLFLK